MLVPLQNTVAATELGYVDYPAAPRNKLYVVGENDIAKQVIASVQNLEQVCVALPNIKNLPERIDPNAIGVVFVEPILGVKEGIAMLRRSSLHRQVPIHVVTVAEDPDDAANWLYGLGVASVNQFPEDKRVLSGIILALSRLKPMPASAATPADARLGQALRARLLTRLKNGLNLQVMVKNGVAILTGRLKQPRLWQKVRDVVNSAPGVHKTVVPQNQ